MENKKLTTCKACGEEVAKNAKICPKCGAKVKKVKPVLLGILIAVVLIAVIAAAGGEEEPKKVEGSKPDSGMTQTNTDTDQTNTEDKNVFNVGETVALKGVEASLVGITESTGSEYNRPADGNVFVLCEFDIYNNSSEELNISTVLSFEAYCDEYACAFSFGALLEKGNKNQLDGTIAVGKRFNGVVGYEVPEDWQKLEVHFNPSIWTGKDIIFVAKNAG